MGAAAHARPRQADADPAAGLEPFGLWVEQLVAESTGKNGVGIVPIAGETLGGRARSTATTACSCGCATHGAPARTSATKSRAAVRVRAGRDIELPEPAALGAEFVRWEIATAVAGALLGINPFDEPNVQQAKDATNALLDALQGRGPAAGRRRRIATTADGIDAHPERRGARRRWRDRGPKRF